MFVGWNTKKGASRNTGIYRTLLTEPKHQRYGSASEDIIWHTRLGRRDNVNFEVGLCNPYTARVSYLREHSIPTTQVPYIYLFEREKRSTMTVTVSELARVTLLPSHVTSLTGVKKIAAFEISTGEPATGVTTSELRSSRPVNPPFLRSRCLQSRPLQN